MSKRTAEGILFSLLLIVAFSSALSVETVRASGTIYIMVDGSVVPETAPISTTDNITYTFAEDVYETIVLERNNIVVDGAGYTLLGTGSPRPYCGIKLDSRYNVTIRNMNIKSFVNGIILKSSSSITIHGNNITGNEQWGIRMEKSNYTVVSENIIADTGHAGIDIMNCSNNRLYRNTFVNDGLMVLYSSRNFIQDNLVNGKPLVYLENVSDRVVYDAGQIILVACENIRIENLAISNTWAGVVLERTNKSTIANNIMTKNKAGGVILFESSSNSIFGNEIAENKDGVSSLSFRFAIRLYSCSRNRIYGNRLEDNSYGIVCVESMNNTILGNLITNNKIGISIENSRDNKFLRNTISNNWRIGVQLYFSENNSVYHNNFMYNSQVIYYSVPNVVNYWDNGYPSGGNYWSGYTGEDSYLGPHQNISNSDGIGDAPYVINDLNKDNYPLMYPYETDAGLLNRLVLWESAELATIHERLLENVSDLMDKYGNLTEMFITETGRLQEQIVQSQFLTLGCIVIIFTLIIAIVYLGHKRQAPALNR